MRYRIDSLFDWLDDFDSMEDGEAAQAAVMAVADFLYDEARKGMN